MNDLESHDDILKIFCHVLRDVSIISIPKRTKKGIIYKEKIRLINANTKRNMIFSKIRIKSKIKKLESDSKIAASMPVERKIDQIIYFLSVF